jgi:outer membrane protein assembly factor BamB
LIKCIFKGCYGMLKHIWRLLMLLMVVFSAHHWVPSARAQGGLVFRPYWTFASEMPVTHVEAGDVDGDGLPEVVILTAGDVVYVLENDGDLAWRYEADFEVDTLRVIDLESDGAADEILLVGRFAIALLGDAGEPICIFRPGFKGEAWGGGVYAGSDEDGQIPYVTLATNLDGDGGLELLFGIRSGIGVMDTACRPIPPFIMSHLVIANWAGDLDGDGRPEIVPSLADSDVVSVFDGYRRLVWQQGIRRGVGLVQGGDVDGDGQPEVVVLGAEWDLFLLEGDGSQVWHNPALSDETISAGPVPGQLFVHDLDGDGRMEILVMAPEPGAALHVFNGDGHHVWDHLLSFLAGSTPDLLAADDIDGDGVSEVVIGAEGQERVYLLDAAGRRLTEYHTGKVSGTLDHADLNDDGWGEIIVGTEEGVQVFGASDQVVWREVWRSHRLGLTSALYLDDLNGDGQAEVIAGSDDGQVFVLSDDGYVVWNMNLEAPVQAVSAGDVDGDGRSEVVVGTWGGAEAGARGQIHLLDGDRTLWSVPVRGFVTSLAVRDLDGDDLAEIVAGSIFARRGVVQLLDGAGGLVWEQEFDEPVTAVSTGRGPDVGGNGGHVLVGTEGGRVHRLTAGGSPIETYELEGRVLSLGAGQAVTADGGIYQMGAGRPTLIRELGQPPWKAQTSGESTVTLNESQKASLVAGDGSIRPGPEDEQVVGIAVGDLNGDGEAEMVVGTEQKRVHLFGLSHNQPPLLTKPDVAETRTGYSYSVDVNDPDGDAVSVTLEIWDPSAGVWLAQPAQLVQGRGRLNWEISEPFDMWDSGQESRFQFSYSNGGVEGALKEIVGPFAIPTTPWYDYYGRRASLAALILAVPVLGLLLYRRQRAYRRSPVGRAEATLKRLQAYPDETLLRLHDLTRDGSSQLTHLPGLAREVGDAAIADLGEGFSLVLTRPEVTAEGLRSILAANESLGGSPTERATAVTSLYDLCQRMLEVNTVSRIVALRTQLAGMEETLGRSDSGVAEVAGALADLNRVTDALRNYQRVDLVEDKVAYLAQAIEWLGRLDREFQTKLHQPERNILTQVALNWLAVSTNTLQDLQGRAQLDVSLRTRQLVDLEGAVLSLELTNTGRSPASNLTVTLLPGQGYAARDGDTAQLNVLPAGRSAVVELPVTATASIDQFRAEFRVTFDDRERSGKSMAFGDMVRLLRPSADFQPIRNPYAPGTPLSSGSPIFYGRDDLFEFIAENMAGRVRQNILVLIGQRRMGKTSFLQQLPARLGSDYLPVYLDGQSLGVDPGMANFFYDLALTISDALVDQGIDLPEPKPEDFQERPSGAFERDFLPVVFEAIGGRQLLLLFDEFEELEMRVGSGKLDPTIFPFIRHLMQHGRDLGFVFVGTHRLEALSSDYWSIFFNIALYKYVTFLDERAARELIVKPVAECGLHYDDLAVDKIFRMTAGHPYFIQLICHALVVHANRERRAYVTIQDVNDVLGEMVELGEAHFAFLWEKSSPMERQVLASLNRLLNHGPSVTVSQIAELLAERGIATGEKPVAEALRQLVEQDILREVPGQPPKYEYKVELVRLWIERYKVLERVIEEVGE